jgi:hypothetical protein
VCARSYLIKRNDNKNPRAKIMTQRPQFSANNADFRPLLHGRASLQLLDHDSAAEPVFHHCTGRCARSSQRTLHLSDRTLFSGSPTSGLRALVAANVCPSQIPVALPAMGSQCETVTYSGFEVGGFVPADLIVSLHTPPWENGPLSPVVHHTKVSSRLPAISLSFITCTDQGEK